MLLQKWAVFVCFLVTNYDMTLLVSLKIWQAEVLLVVMVCCSLAPPVMECAVCFAPCGFWLVHAYVELASEGHNS